MPLFPLRTTPLAGTEKILSFPFSRYSTNASTDFSNWNMIVRLCSLSAATSWRTDIGFIVSFNGTAAGEVPLSVLPAQPARKSVTANAAAITFLYAILSFHLFLTFVFFRPADNLIHRPLRQIPFIRY